MADNTTSYKATIDIDVQPSIAQLKKLQKELKTTTDPVKFKELQQQIDDMKESINAAKTGAGNFAEVIGSLPGPIGEVGNRVGGLIGTLKTFSQTRFTDIKGSFAELGKDLGDIAKGFAKLTGLTTVYTTVTNASSKALQFFGVSLNSANTAGRALGLTLSTLLAATGILAIIAAVNLLSNAWENFSTKAERADEAQKKLNESIQKGNKAALDAESAYVRRSGDLLVAQAKARGANANEIFKIEQQNKRLLVASQQRYYDSIKEKDSDEARSALITLKDTQNSILISQADFEAQKLEKSKQAGEKTKQQTETDLKTIKKNAAEATNSLLTEREQARQKVYDDYKEKIDLAKKYGKDTYVLEEAQRKALKDLKDKNDAEDATKDREVQFQKLQDLIDGIEYENNLLDYDYAEDQQRLANEGAYLAAQKDIELAAINDKTENAASKRLEIIAKYAKKEQDIDKALTDSKKAEIQARTDIQLKYADYLQQFGNLLGQVAGKNKDLAIAGIIIEQGAALAKVIIQTSAANAAATAGAAPFLANPLTAIPAAANLARVITMNNIQGALSAAGIIAGAVKGISAIKSAQVPGGSGGGSVSTGGVQAPAAPAIGSIGAPQITGTTGGTNPTTQIAETLANATNKPIRAYVVSGDVSSQQALDRRTSAAATFGG
jgi:hypothetical protein